MAKKKYDLVGVDGNAFAVMGYVKRAMRESGFSPNAISQYIDEAISGDYNNLLRVSVYMIYKCNQRNGEEEDYE